MESDVEEKKEKQRAELTESGRRTDGSFAAVSSLFVFRLALRIFLQLGDLRHRHLQFALFPALQSVINNSAQTQNIGTKPESATDI